MISHKIRWYREISSLYLWLFLVLERGIDMLETKYDHLSVEDKKYDNWVDKGYF